MRNVRERITHLAFFHSLRVRLLVLVIIFVVSATTLLGVYTSHLFEEATTLQLKHEGLLLSDTLEADLGPVIEARDIAGMQEYIDRLVAARERNDIEINIMLLNGDTSATVASNIPDNIQETDEEEHKALLESLENENPVVFIEQSSLSPEDKNLPPTYPDYYLNTGKRIMSITTPLIIDGRKFGSINVALSLTPLDEKLDVVRKTLQAAAIAEALVIIVALGLLLNVQIFKPLLSLSRDMNLIADGDLNRQAPFATRRDEIGVLAKSFNSMARQLAHTQSQLHQYLNPLAIEEAYRRAGDERAKPLAEEREITVLFVDVVSFTATSERLGPSRTVAYLNRYYDLITAALVDSGGYIDKFVADEAVCVFDNAGHADQAVSTARSILHLLTSSLESDLVQVRIGINTGACIVADVGSQAVGRLDRTVIGDTVNIAQRLMTNTQPNTAMLSANTFAALANSTLGIHPAGEQRLKGKSQTVTAYQLCI